MGTFLISWKDEKEQRAGYEIMKNAARSGSFRAETKLGYSFRSGWGTGVTHIQAAIHYKITAESGDIDALCSYEYVPMYGKGVEKKVKDGLLIQQTTVNPGQ